MLLAWGLLAQTDVRDRLLEAVRESRLGEVRELLAWMAVEGDPARTVRALVQALPKARERVEPMLAHAERARQSVWDFDTAPGFDLREETLRERQRELLCARVRELEVRALAAERICSELAGILRFLPRGAVPALAAEAERQGSWILKCELLEGLAALGAAEELRAAAAREKDPVVLATAVAGMGDESAAGFLAHPQWQVRLAALEAVRGRRAATGEVVRAMERLDGRFRRAAARDLERVTRTGLPPEPALWRDWWLANREDVLAGLYVPTSVRWPEGARPTVFYDVPVDSTRVCFLVDRSRSMRQDGRFADAKRELVRLLEALPDGSLFNVVFFGGSQSVFARGVRALDASSRREASDWIDRAGLEDATDLYAGLLKALQFTGSLETGRLREDGLDTIVVLSDGKATWGRVVDEELLAATFARKARWFRPVVHGVGVGGESKTLRLLAERTGGEYRVR